MIVEARNLEIRGVEKRASKKSEEEYLIVELKMKQVEHMNC